MATDRPNSSENYVAAREWWIKRSWTGLWWIGLNPNEALATMDTHTIHRAWTRARLIAKLARKPKSSPWEEVRA